MVRAERPRDGRPEHRQLQRCERQRPGGVREVRRAFCFVYTCRRLIDLSNDCRYGLFQGEVRNVSFLHAPGFCNVKTNFNGKKHDLASFIDGALRLTVRHTHGENTQFRIKMMDFALNVMDFAFKMMDFAGENHHYAGFKVALSSPGAPHHGGPKPGHELSGSYKSDFHRCDFRPIFDQFLTDLGM